MSNGHWYFAYGSNMSATIFIARRGMRPAASKWGWLDGYRLCFELAVGPGERGVANIVPETGARTYGVLYAISAEEADRLDRTEGVHVGIYQRIAVVVSAGPERVEAFTYQSPYASPGRKPSARYIGLLLDGAGTHGLPAEYISFLRSFELAFDERPEYQKDEDPQ